MAQSAASEAGKKEGETRDLLPFKERGRETVNVDHSSSRCPATLKVILSESLFLRTRVIIYNFHLNVKKKKKRKEITSSTSIFLEYFI